MHTSATPIPSDRPWAILLTHGATTHTFARYTSRADAETDLNRLARFLRGYTLEVYWHG